MVDWKKEYKVFGKGRSKPEAEAGGTKTPWYKKEVSLKRDKGEPTPAAEAPPVEATAADDVPEPVALPPVVEPEPVVQPEPVAAVEPTPILPTLTEPVAQLEPAWPEPIAESFEPVAEPEPERAVSWVDAVLSGAPSPVEPAVEPQPVEPIVPQAPALPEPVAQVEPPALVPVPALPELEPTPLAPPAVEPVVVSEPVVAPDPRPINPPVRADDLPSLEEEPQVPWYKRDLSRGRKATKEPKAVDRGAKSTPFWKKELTFTRSGKAEAEPIVSEPPQTAGPAPAAPVEKPAPAPFWKRELGRKSKPAADGAAEKPAKPSKPTSEPFWKKGVSMPTLSRPQRGGGGRAAVPKQLVGLKVGASQVAAARVANNGHAEVLQLARESLEPGVVVGGELRDPEALAETLKGFFQRNKLPKKAVRLGIANNRIGVRTFDIVGIDDPKQLTNAIRFRAQEALPIPIEEAVLDYQVLSESVNEEGEKVRKILLVVAYRELVDQYVAACRKAGITIVGIDLEAFALLRALAAPIADGTDASAALVAVAVGHDRSTFAVSDGRVCEFTRVLEWGGQNLSVAIARALDLSPSEAEPIKHALSLSSGATPEGLSDEHATAAREAVSRQVSNFARELVSSLQFYQSQPNSLGIGEIVLTGGTAHLDGFAEELQRVIGVKVRIGDPLTRVKVSKRFREPEQIGSLSVAIGLGIED